MDACSRAIEHLQNSGLLCYTPGVAVGVCKTPYVVVRASGSYTRGQGYAASVGYRTISLHCFVPRTGGDLAALVAKVKTAMRALSDQLRPTGNEGPEIIEADYDARSQTLEYYALRAARE